MVIYREQSYTQTQVRMMYVEAKRTDTKTHLDSAAPRRGTTATKATATTACISGYGAAAHAAQPAPVSISCRTGHAVAATATRSTSTSMQDPEFFGY